MKAKNILAITITMLLAGTAMAQAGTPQEQRVDNRQARQATRIANGTASGALTQREQHRLARQQNTVQHIENKVEADGVVTGKEAIRLEQAQDAASKSIARNKHDRQQQKRAN
jgi:hypothetical protein